MIKVDTKLYNTLTRLYIIISIDIKYTLINAVLNKKRAEPLIVK